MLAPEDERQPAEPPRFSLASDIVELIVLTADEVFLQTLREAVGASRRLWHVPSSDKVGDLLLAGGVGILVLDLHALRQPGAAFVAQIKHQFPDLVIVVAGTRDTESELARLISDGTVYRFIHKPVSPARARLFADAAVRRLDEQRRRAGAAAARTPPRSGSLMIAGGCVAVFAIACGLWAVLHVNREPSDIRRADADVPAAGAPAAAAGPELAATPATHPAAAVHAGRANAFAPAGRTAPIVRTAPADRSARGAAASNSLAAEQRRRPPADSLQAQATPAPHGQPSLQANAAPPLHGHPSVLAPVPPPQQVQSPVLDPAAPSAALAMQRIQQGRLVDSRGDDARFYVQQALRINPGSEAAGSASEALALGLLKAARGAVDRRDFQAAANWLDAADGIASPANVANLRRLLAAAQHPAEDPHAASQTTPSSPAHRSTPAVPASATAASAPSESAVVDADQLVVLTSVQPEYPRKAREASIEGWVELEFTVTESGQVTDLSVRGAQPRGVFDQAAMSAVSRWRYKPARIDAKPVARRARVRIRFALAG